jgi:hypothetical protein
VERTQEGPARSDFLINITRTFAANSLFDPDLVRDQLPQDMLH